jgi:hypothetical protein
MNSRSKQRAESAFARTRRSQSQQCHRDASDNLYELMKRDHEAWVATKVAIAKAKAL